MYDVDFVNLLLGVCHCASQSPIGVVATVHTTSVD
jgi:hypothetical protein